MKQMVLLKEVRRETIPILEDNEEDGEVYVAGFEKPNFESVPKREFRGLREKTKYFDLIH